jgi:hypothetical protein
MAGRSFIDLIVHNIFTICFPFCDKFPLSVVVSYGWIKDPMFSPLEAPHDLPTPISGLLSLDLTQHALFHSIFHWHPPPAVRSRAGGSQTINPPDLSGCNIPFSFFLLFEFHTQTSTAANSAAVLVCYNLRFIFAV